MRRILWLAASVSLVAIIGCSAGAQTIRAITQDGKSVILRPDGTWQYAGENTTPTGAPPSASTYNRLASATKEITGKRVGYAIWIDDAKWGVDDTPSNKAADYSFNHTRGDAYAMVLSERIPIPLNNLRNIAINNARAIAKDIRVTQEEKRTVNGLEVLLLKMEGTAQGIPFVFYGYYYSGRQGTVQLVTYTAQTLFPEYKADFEELLNGLVAR
jgi:hypothetical protein